jgi:hypothetical protein
MGPGWARAGVTGRQNLTAAMTGQAAVIPVGACFSPEVADAQRLLAWPEHADPGDRTCPAWQPGIPGPPDGQPAAHGRG